MNLHHSPQNGTRKNYKGLDFDTKLACISREGTSSGCTAVSLVGGILIFRIFREGVKNALLPDEKVIAERGCRDERCVYIPHDFIYLDMLYATCRARHETVNLRIEQFNIIE